MTRRAAPGGDVDPELVRRAVAAINESTRQIEAVTEQVKSERFRPLTKAEQARARRWCADHGFPAVADDSPLQLLIRRAVRRGIYEGMGLPTVDETLEEMEELARHELG